MSGQNRTQNGTEVAGIVERLRRAVSGDLSVVGGEMVEEAADEIERLQAQVSELALTLMTRDAEMDELVALIAEWATADAVVQHQKNLNRYSNRGVPAVFSRRLSDAAEALRAEARKVKS